jgi:hypothetical protein
VFTDVSVKPKGVVFPMSIFKRGPIINGYLGHVFPEISDHSSLKLREFIIYLRIA